MISYSNSYTESDVVATAARAEFHSTHPLALTSHALANNVALTPPDQFEQMIGMGIHAQWIGDSILVGNLRLMSKFNVAVPHQVLYRHAESANAGETVMLIAAGNRVIGLVACETRFDPGQETLLIHFAAWARSGGSWHQRVVCRADSERKTRENLPATTSRTCGRDGE